MASNGYVKSGDGGAFSDMNTTQEGVGGGGNT